MLPDSLALNVCIAPIILHNTLLIELLYMKSAAEFDKHKELSSQANCGVMGIHYLP